MNEHLRGLRFYRIVRTVLAGMKHEVDFLKVTLGEDGEPEVNIVWKQVADEPKG